MNSKTLTKPQVIALLRIAEHDLGSQGPTDADKDVWMECGRCERDLIGASVVPTSTSARSAIIRAGYAHQNLYGQDRHGGPLRFELTPKGEQWIREICAVSALIRGLRRLPFDL